MEDILDVYARPYDPKYPVICLDETSKQLVTGRRKSIPMKPGHPKKYDYSYYRNGNKALTIVFEPLMGWREIVITDTRGRKEWVDILKYLSDVVYPYAERIVLVQDNLVTHLPRGMYEILPPEEARYYLKRFEFHFTPIHASWLNMAEIELSVLARQCLAGRISNEMHLKSEIESWSYHRNNCGKSMNWQFKNEDARMKLKQLYPTYSS